LIVIKKDSRREPFSREKLLKSIQKSTEKRPIPLEKIEKISEDIEQELRNLKSYEIKWANFIITATTTRVPVLDGHLESVYVELSKEVEVDGVKYVINGWPDYYDGYRVIELKYTSHPVKEPENRHIQQVRMYLWLTEARKGYLLYITPRKVYEFEIDNPMTNEEVVELIKNWTSPRDPSECTQCIFRSVCPHSVERVERQPKEQKE